MPTTTFQSRKVLLPLVPVALALAFQGCKLITYEREMTLVVTPASATIALGTTLPFKAELRYGDDPEPEDVTLVAEWHSSDAGVARVGSDGVATPVAAGTTVITASARGASGGTALTVSNAQLRSIEVTPADASIANGTRLQMKATGRFDDETTQDLTAQVTWTSSEPTVAVDAKGLARSTELGDATATVTAAFAGTSGFTVLTVRGATLTAVEVTPATATVVVGQSVQFTATGAFSDASGSFTQDLTREVTWESSNTSIATVTATTGLARGRAAASSSISITATSSALLGPKTGSAELKVDAAAGGY